MRVCVCVYPALVMYCCLSRQGQSSDGFIPDDRFMTVCQKASRGSAETVCLKEGNMLLKR